MSGIDPIRQYHEATKKCLVLVKNICDLPRSGKPSLKAILFGNVEDVKPPKLPCEESKLRRLRKLLRKLKASYEDARSRERDGKTAIVAPNRPRVLTRAPWGHDVDTSHEGFLDEIELVLYLGPLVGVPFGTSEWKRAAVAKSVEQDRRVPKRHVRGPVRTLLSDSIRNDRLRTFYRAFERCELAREKSVWECRIDEEYVQALKSREDSQVAKSQPVVPKAPAKEGQSPERALSADPVTSPPAISTHDKGEPPRYLFRRNGAVYDVRFEDESSTIGADLAGAKHISELLQHPNKCYKPTDLAPAIESSDVDPRQIKSQVAEYIDQLGGIVRDLQQERDRRAPDADCDNVTIHSLQADQQRIYDKLRKLSRLPSKMWKEEPAKAVSLMKSGRGLRGTSSSDAVRVRVAKAVKLVKVKCEMELGLKRFASHLNKHLHTSTDCIYQPPDPGPSA